MVGNWDRNDSKQFDENSDENSDDDLADEKFKPYKRRRFEESSSDSDTDEHVYQKNYKKTSDGRKVKTTKRKPASIQKRQEEYETVRKDLEMSDSEPDVTGMVEASANFTNKVDELRTQFPANPPPPKNATHSLPLPLKTSSCIDNLRWTQGPF